MLSIMEAKDYPPSFTSRSTDFIQSDQQSDSRIITDDEKLPPVDGGTQAWLFLIASAMLESLVWGMRADAIACFGWELTN